jgi:very-short-patch-repair endonuclease
VIEPIVFVKQTMMWENRIHFILNGLGLVIENLFIIQGIVIGEQHEQWSERQQLDRTFVDFISVHWRLSVEVSEH